MTMYERYTVLDKNIADKSTARLYLLHSTAKLNDY